LIILGLGSNIGDRLQYLRGALHALKNIPGVSVQQVSPVYISDAELPEHAPPSWNQTFLNCAVRCASSLAPQELLTAIKKIEADFGRNLQNPAWSPRVVDIDILAQQDQNIATEQLIIPHRHLLNRPFALWPLADLIPTWQYPGQQLTAEQIVEKWGSRFSGDAPFNTRQINQRIDTPRLVGIINVTPDSFSDGGKFISAEQAFHQAIHLMDAGAEILDVGAESTAPHSSPLTPRMEWQRLQPVLTAVMQAKHKFIIPPVISVDTRHAEVAQHAVALGVDWINDVTGFQDPAMRAAVRNAKVDCVVMHHLSIPPVRGETIPRDQDPVEFLHRWSEKQIALLEQDGIHRDRIIIDPGFGFGKSPGQAIALLQRSNEFADLGVRILVGHSRKSFMTVFTPHTAAERDIETLAMTLHLAGQPIDYLRVHNVEISTRALRVQAALRA
jgi:2-amino-4-hydroxy-6-hydroxymethyldihydropteridine diphosphokinase/dihydropteroate synthase